MIPKILCVGQVVLVKCIGSDGEYVETFRCDSGFGMDDSKIGTKIYGQWSNGERGYIRRYNIVGLAQLLI